jgi:hypothetical protein
MEARTLECEIVEDSVRKPHLDSGSNSPSVRSSVVHMKQTRELFSFDTALRNGDTLEMRKIETTKEGNVSAYVNFAMQTYCDDSDFANFPNDLYQCCFSIQPHVLQELIRFQADSVPVFTDPKYFRDYGWRMSGTTPSAGSTDDGIAVLNFCINMQRQSATLKIELTLPTTVCAVLLLLSPLLGSFRMQMAVKLFILLLQFLALQLFANRIASHLGSASATPRICASEIAPHAFKIISLCSQSVRILGHGEHDQHRNDNGAVDVRQDSKFF